MVRGERPEAGGPAGRDARPAAPEPADPAWPRYSSRAFPPYRFVPGRSPHPITDPRGHSYGHRSVDLPPVAPERWRESEEYRYGIDLYNFAYWWECHEALEGLWNAVGRSNPQGQFLQGIIQVSAANLKKFMGSPAAAGLAEEGLARLRGLPARYMGVDVAEFEGEVRAYFAGRRDAPVQVRLRG